jgi:hypothetical protein
MIPPKHAERKPLGLGQTPPMCRHAGKIGTGWWPIGRRSAGSPLASKSNNDEGAHVANELARTAGSYLLIPL